MDSRDTSSGIPAGAATYSPSRRPHWGTLTFVVLLHLAALAGLVRVFAPDFATAAIDKAASLVTVTVTMTAPPERAPEPLPSPESNAEGAEGREAVPREVTAPPAPLPRPSSAPRAPSSGSQDSAGAGEQGQGDGAGGAGVGPGSVGSGEGRGGLARPLELISGTIDNARDYPVPPGGRRVRRGHDVVIELTVGPDGRVRGCRVTDPSPDAEADAITCRLATERFTFRPRLNAAGEPVTGLFRWQQRWF